MDYHKAISSLSLAVTPVLLVYAISGQGDIKAQLARVNEKVTATNQRAERIEKREGELITRTDDRYRRSDAMKDFGEVDARIDRIELEFAKCCGYEKAPD